MTLHSGKWWEPLIEWRGTFELVVTNPPYIPESILLGLEPIVKDHEPHLALSGGADGLQSFKEIFKKSKFFMKKDALIICEHHYDQSDVVLVLMRTNGLIDVSFEKDLQGIKRFAIGKCP